MGRDVVELRELPDVNKLLLKALAGAVTKKGRRARLPDRSMLVMGHEQSLRGLAEYCKVTGFTLRDTVPATWLHVQTFPMQAALMAQDDFPFSLAGLVHVSNRMRLHRPVRVGEGLRMAVRTEHLAAHAKGAVFDMVGEIHVGDDLAWSGSSTYLATGARVEGEPADALRLTAPQEAPSQQWRLPADLGRQYARVSGDSNPIHLYPLTARLFGFPRPIIHGMWTHARALAALGGRLPETYEVQVQFAKPILLPGKVGFAAAGQDGSWRFAVVNREGKPHLVGEVS
ncbi:MaoC/PaaZ C-terminal domain-containing protein [Tessaracoccus lubricantis]|uniref:MaoC/PaaZ C-terminal domain-containing protein n=1 Tax=Tessaracoccus lubricantis TaxID=545543 RepID=A0ABP9F7C3_9ACTN